VPTDVEDPGEDLATLPTSIMLHQNYPNPFNPTTTITFDMPRRGEYRLEVINMLGQTIFEQVAVASAGRVVIDWDGDEFASGAYLYRLTVDGNSLVRKMVLLK
jgi:hypothetical protein